MVAGALIADQQAGQAVDQEVDQGAVLVRMVRLAGRQADTFHHLRIANAGQLQENRVRLTEKHS
jgi:hypothetical protein